jgi:antitoxin ParD1/3/4
MNINFPPMDEKYIKEMVKKGYYSNATEVVRDAVRRQREKNVSEYDVEKRLYDAIKKGEADIKAGRTVPYDKNFWKRIEKNARARIKSGKPIKYDPDVIPYEP